MLLKEFLLINIILLSGVFLQEGGRSEGGLIRFPDFPSLDFDFPTIVWSEWGQWEQESVCDGNGNFEMKRRSGNATLREDKLVPCSGTSFCELNPCPSGHQCFEQESIAGYVCFDLLRDSGPLPTFPDTSETALKTTRTPNMRELPPINTPTDKLFGLNPTAEWVEWGEWEQESACTGISKTRTRSGNATLSERKWETCSYCEPNPCQNGGVCHSPPFTLGYWCSCGIEYAGSNCEIDYPWG